MSRLPPNGSLDDSRRRARGLRSAVRRWPAGRAADRAATRAAPTQAAGHGLRASPSVGAALVAAPLPNITTAAIAAWDCRRCTGEARRAQRRLE
jgi:hypothetical protein